MKLKIFLMNKFKKDKSHPRYRLQDKPVHTCERSSNKTSLKLSINQQKAANTSLYKISLICCTLFIFPDCTHSIRVIKPFSQAKMPIS